MTSVDDLLAERYGRQPERNQSRNRTALYLFAGLAVAAFLVWAGFSVAGRTSAITVLDSSSKSLTATSFEVSARIARPAEGIARCAVIVKALNFAVVGYREVTLPAGQNQFTTTVFTTSLGVNATVDRCWMQ